MKYVVPVYWTVCGTVEVEASSKAEAYSAAYDAPLPDNGEYVDGSFEVDEAFITDDDDEEDLI